MRYNTFRILCILCAFTLLVSFLQASRVGEPTNMPQWTNEIDSWFMDKKAPWNMPGAQNSAFSLDGKQAFLSLTNGGLAVVDLRDQTVRNIIDFSMILGHGGIQPDAVAVSPTGMMAAAFPDRHEVLLIDQAKMRVVERVKTAFPPLALRFSPLGRFLFIGNQKDKHTWSCIYSIQRREYILSRITPMICDISRDDRYIYLYDEARNSLRWMTADTRQTIRQFNLSTISPIGEPYTIKVLRDHRIAIGFKGSVTISDRYLRQIELMHVAPMNAGDVSFIEPSHDNRYLIFGRRGALHILSLVHNISTALELPAGVGGVDAYPKGNYIIFSNPADMSTRIVGIDIPSRTSKH